jgi:transposase InsO family protein
VTADGDEPATARCIAADLWEIDGNVSIGKMSFSELLDENGVCCGTAASPSPARCEQEGDHHPPGPGRRRASDRIDRDFLAPVPNRIWVANFTYVAARASVVYVAFVVDTVSRPTIDWSASMPQEPRLVLGALGTGPWQPDREGRPPVPGKLVHHSDEGNTHVPPGRTPRAACAPARP